MPKGENILCLGEIIMGIPKVFISHSFKDKIITDALVELLKKSGIPKNQIVSSSTPGTQIHTGDPLYKALRKELSNNKTFVIFLLSDNFYSSKVCLNEMGATWIKRLPYRFMILPGFSFSKVEGVIKEDEQVGFSLFDLDEDTKARFTHLQTDLSAHFGIEIQTDTWELGLINFFAAVRKYKEMSSSPNVLSMRDASGVCIGDDQHNGCYVWGRESSDTKATAIVDFSRTKSNLCSIVFPTEKYDWHQYVENKKLLCFDIYSDTINIPAQVEVQLAKGRNITVPILITDDVQSIHIPLTQFTASLSAWQDVNRVCFLFSRDNVPAKATIIIENLRLDG